MAEIDGMAFGRYMRILREREKRRNERRGKSGGPRDRGAGDNAVYLHRGTIDEVW